MRDAMFLDLNRTFEGGAAAIARRFGLEGDLPLRTESQGRRPPSLQLDRKDRNWKTLGRSAPSPRSARSSPGRFLSPPRGLANLIQEVPGIWQKQTENWKVRGAVRGAVGEVRRNMNNFQEGSSQTKGVFSAPETPISSSNAMQNTPDALRQRLSSLHRRNTALAGMLEEVLEELRTQEQPRDTEQAIAANDKFNVTLARLQFVQIYLADSETPMSDHRLDTAPANRMGGSEADSTAGSSQVVSLGDSTSGSLVGDETRLNDRAADRQDGNNIGTEDTDEPKSKSDKLSSPQARPALAQSPLSWILGEGQHRSDFVSSSTPPPEQRRESTPKPKPKRLFPKEDEDRDGSESEDDGFTMSRLDGCHSKKNEG
jgi:TBC1 domain family member 5